MDNIFRTRVLTGAINMMMTPSTRAYTRFFAGKSHMEPTDRMAFDIITGNENLLPNLSVIAPATTDSKTSRTTVTMTAPRLAHKRFIHAAELNAMRQYGGQATQEMMEGRVNRELRDMRGKFDRTLEYWCMGALRGIIYDNDMTTELVNYGIAASHTSALTGTNLWTNASSSPLNRIRAFKKTIDDDAGTTINGWFAYMGSNVMDALLKHSDVLDLLKYQVGNRVSDEGRITRLAEVDFEEYNGSFIHTDGTRQRFIGEDYFMLIGLCDDLVDLPYAPVIDDDAPGGVGNPGAGQLYFSKSWKENDPSGRWIKAEGRPLPVLQRPGAIIYKKVV